MPRLSLNVLSSSLLIAVLVGCTGDEKGTDTSTGDGGTDTGDTGEEPEIVVWESVSIESSKSVSGIFVSQQDEAWISMGGGQTRLFQSGSWTTVNIDVEDQDLNGIWGSGSGSSATVVTVGDAGFIGTWNGATFEITDVGTTNFESIDGPFETDLLAVGWGGIYSNASGEWEYVNITGGHRFNHVWYDGAIGAAVGEEGALGLYSKGTWTIIQEPERRAFYGVSGTGPNDIWAVGEKGTVLHWNGTEWEDLSPEVGEYGIWAVWAPNASNVFIVGNSGLAMVRRSGTWEELPTGTNKNLYAVGGTGLSDVWAGGGFGTVLRYQP